VADQQVERSTQVRYLFIAAALGLLATFLIEELESIKWITTWLAAKKDLIPSKFSDFILIPPVTWKSRVPAWIALGAIAYKWGAPSFDSAFLSSHDTRALAPITRHTGIFLFYLPADGAVREAWDALGTWARTDAGDGRTWGRNRKTIVHFRWTALLGPNGVGKTQLAKELARALAQREKRGDFLGGRGTRARVRLFAASLGNRIRRALPWARTDGDPWDVGLVASRSNGAMDAARLVALKSWKPRAPTLFVLDDPAAGVVSTVVELLGSRAGSFRFPVRLIIVDQFVGMDWPVEPHSEGRGWLYQGLPIHLFTLKAEFSVDLFRAASARFWTDFGGVATSTPKSPNDLRSLWKTEDLERLVTAVEGNPLLLALAVLWLDADHKRTVDDLLTTNLVEAERQLGFDSEHASLRDLVAHRLLSDRVEELYQSYRKVDEKHHISLRKAVASATIGGGTSLAAFGMDSLEQGALRNLFPLTEKGRVIETIPPLRPWIIGEAFVRKVRFDIYAARDAAFEQEIVQPAFVAHPEGVLKTMLRGGETGRAIAAAVAQAPVPDDPGKKLRRFAALAAHASMHDATYIEPAFRLLTAFPSGLPGRALAELQNLEALNLDGRADVLVVFALSAALAARRLVEDDCTEEEVARIQRWFADWTHAISAPLHHAATKQVSEAAAFYPAALGLSLHWRSERRLPPEVRFANAAMLDDIMARHTRASAHRPIGETVDAVTPQSPWPALWRCREYLVNQEDPQTVFDAFEAFLAEQPLDEEEKTLIGARARNFAAEGFDLAGRLRNALQIDAVAFPFPENKFLIAERVVAWSSVAQMQDTNAALETLAHIDTLIPSEFTLDPHIVRMHAEAWLSVIDDEQHIDDAVSRIDAIAAPFLTSPRDYPHVALVRIRAARQLMKLLGKKSVRAEQIYKKLEELAIQLDAPPLRHPGLIQDRILSLLFIARHRSGKDTGQLEQQLAAVDGFAEPFARRGCGYPGVIMAAGHAWKEVADGWSGSRDFERTLRTARHVTNLFRHFRAAPTVYPGISQTFLEAWVRVVETSTRDAPRAEKWARQVDTWAAPFGEVPAHFPRQVLYNIVHEHAKAWRFVAFARCNAGQSSTRVEEIVRRVDEIVSRPTCAGAPFGHRYMLELERINAWMALVKALLNEHADVTAIEAATDQVDAIASPFLSSSQLPGPSLALGWGDTWCAVAVTGGQRSDLHHLVLRSLDALKHLVERFADDPNSRHEALSLQRKAFTAVAESKSVDAAR